VFVLGEGDVVDVEVDVWAWEEPDACGVVDWVEPAVVVGELEVVDAALGVVAEAGVVVVEAAVDEVALVDVLAPGGPVEVVVDEPADVPVTESEPLSLSSVSISCCTVATAAAIAVGVPLAPSLGNAPSWLRSEFSLASRAADGWTESVTTIWSATAVVMQAGQLSLSASATLIGVTILLRPTTRTTWKETATVVQLWQFAKA
jgi:hypothetical protein